MIYYIIGFLISLPLLLPMIGTMINVSEHKRREREERHEMEEDEDEINRLILQQEDDRINNPPGFFASKLKTELLLYISEDAYGEDNCYWNPEVACELYEGILMMDILLPQVEHISRVKDIYYLKNGNEKKKLYSDREFATVYDDGLYVICMRALAYVFELQSDEGFDLFSSALFNGYVINHDPATGREQKVLIMSLLAQAADFNDIDWNYVNAKAWFRAKKGISASKLIDCVPVLPALTFDMNDKRFVKPQEVSVDGINLAAMDWEDFEHLVREVFELEFSGSDVEVTQASRDGGVDAVILDPNPIRGGKLIVQAKRYTNTVPVAAVRELYGTVINEGANSGILITTSDYGADSYEFAKGKPLKLLNGGHLLGMLEKFGHKAYIDLKEAKQLSHD